MWPCTEDATNQLALAEASQRSCGSKRKATPGSAIHGVTLSAKKLVCSSVDSSLWVVYIVPICTWCHGIVMTKGDTLNMAFTHVHKKTSQLVLTLLKCISRRKLLLRQFSKDYIHPTINNSLFYLVCLTMA